MTHVTFKESSFDDYLAHGGDSPEAQAEETEDREAWIKNFPFYKMLELAYPELDNALRWCWNNFGEMDGECIQKDSTYRMCNDQSKHRHKGKWTSHWFVKIDYDFGFNEFYFSNEADLNLFLANLPNLNWGEHYPK